MLEVSTAFAGGLYGINPFDQPGVEEGKLLTYAMMGRPGFEGKEEGTRKGEKEAGIRDLKIPPLPYGIFSERSEALRAAAFAPNIAINI